MSPTPLPLESPVRRTARVARQRLTRGVQQRHRPQLRLVQFIVPHPVDRLFRARPPLSTPDAPFERYVHENTSAKLTRRPAKEPRVSASRRAPTERSTVARAMQRSAGLAAHVEHHFRIVYTAQCT